MSDAQEWTIINPSFDPPGNYNMSCGLFIDYQNGWFIEGYPATIWKTTNGGINWELVFDSSNVAFHDIEFSDIRHGWVLGTSIGGYNFFLLKTVDRGNTWQEIAIPPMNRIMFFNSQRGIAGEDSIYLTVDGGITWDVQTIVPVNPSGIYDIFFVDDQRGWIVGDSYLTDVGIILQTTDGGETWLVQQQTTPIFKAIHFVDSLRGFAAGFNVFTGGVIGVTTNGGGSWNYHYLNSPWLRDIVFINDSTGWALGDSGYLLYTQDRGTSWVQILINTDADLGSIVFVENGDIGYIFGDNNTLLKYEGTGADILHDEPSIPSNFKLYQNYPNPFNPNTTIRYDLPERGQVNLVIYDILGRQVRTLVAQFEEAGYRSVIWEGTNDQGRAVGAGVYLCRIAAGDYVKTNKMILLK